MGFVRDLAALLALALACRTAVAQTPDSAAQRAPGPGVYTAAQAERGAAVFKQSCAACHAAAEFTGPRFLQTWGTGTAYQFFEFLRLEMPYDSPGSLEPAAYAAAIAYLLKLNGLPPGDVELPTDPTALRKIPLTPPSTPER